MKMTKEIFQKGDKKHQDSFWFEGQVATISTIDKNGDERNIYIYAVGDIRIHNKEGELVYDAKARNSGFPEFPKGLQTDKDLAKLEKYGYTWENNNWFSLEYDINNGKRHDFLGAFAHTFDSAIESAEISLTDEKFWKELKEKG